MRQHVIAIVLGALVTLSACDTTSDQARSTARVVIGSALGAVNPAESISTLGAPTDPTTGQTGVTQAELTIFRSGNQVFFDTNGLEVDESDSTPILLTSTASNQTLTLYHGTYDFLITARDSQTPTNDLADGNVTNLTINDDITITIPLLSLIGSAELSAPTMVLPNQYFDVLLNVHPPGRTDLHVPTGDYTTDYSFTGATSLQGQSNLGARLLAVCDEIDLEARITRLGEANPPTVVTNRIIPVDFTCPPVDATIGIDLIPPYINITSHTNGDTVAHQTYVTLSGEANDAQTGIQSVEIYDGVVLIQNATITEPTEAGQPSTWEADWFYTYDERTYDLVIIATDNAGNQSQVTLQLTSESP